jgi:hypothetical protein
MNTSLIKCSFDGQAITVGEKKTLSCDLGHPLAQNSHAEFTNLIDKPADKNQTFEIQFLGEPSLHGSVLNQTFTSYKVGSHTFNQIHIKSEGQEYLVSPFTVEVKTVVSGSPTPFPIAGPEGVPIPWWWWSIWGVLLFILAAGGVWQIIKVRRKRVAEKITPVAKLNPREVFQAKIRKLESKGLHNKGEYKAFALELTAIIKKTIGEELSFAADDLTSEELLITLERRHRNYFNIAGKTIEKFLADLDQIKFAKIESNAQACTDLLDRGARIGNALFGRTS